MYLTRARRSPVTGDRTFRLAEWKSSPARKTCCSWRRKPRVLLWGAACMVSRRPASCSDAGSKSETMGEKTQILRIMRALCFSPSVCLSATPPLRGRYCFFTAETCGEKSLRFYCIDGKAEKAPLRGGVEFAARGAGGRRAERRYLWHGVAVTEGVKRGRARF